MFGPIALLVTILFRFGIDVFMWQWWLYVGIASIIQDPIEMMIKKHYRRRNDK